MLNYVLILFGRVWTQLSAIIQYLLFILVLSYCTTLLYVIWAVVSAVAAFLTLGTYVFIVHNFTYCFSVFSDIVLFCVSKIN